MTANAELGLPRPVGLLEGRLPARHKSVQPASYSEKEIAHMIQTPPQGLKDREIAYTPVGTWARDHDLFIFDMKSSDQISRITKPSRKDKLVKLVKAVSMIH